MLSSIQSNHQVLQIGSLTRIKLAEVNNFCSHLVHTLSTILLFHTEEDSYVLSELQNDVQYINTSIGGRITSVSSCQVFKDALIETIEKKIGPTSEEIIKELCNKIRSENGWGKMVCVHTAGYITAVKHLSYEDKHLGAIAHALNQIPQRKFLFLTLDKVIQTATATSLNTKIDKALLTAEILELDANGISNDFIVAALATQGALDQQEQISTIECLAHDILGNIFSLLDDKSILSLLLSSKILLNTWGKENEFWAKIMMPRLNAQQSQFIKKEDYQKIWRKRTTLNIEDFQLHLPYAMKEIIRLVREDNHLELFRKANKSRMSDQLDAILENDTDKASRVFRSSDFAVIKTLMPHILDVFATKSFELFIRTFYFMVKFKLSWASMNYERYFFKSLERNIFENKQIYFIIKFIELTFTYSNDLCYMKSLILSCAEHNVLEYLGLALKEVDLSIKKFSPLFNDVTLCNIVLNNPISQHIQNKFEYMQAIKKYTNSQLLIQNTLDNKTVSEMEELFGASQLLWIDLMKIKSKMENDKQIEIQQ